MKLADALRGLPERALRPYRALAGHLAGDGTQPAQLAALLMAPAAVRARLGRLEPPALTALRILWFQGPGANSWMRTTVFRRIEPQASMEQALRTLEEQALILPSLSAGALAIPEELIPQFAALAAGEWLADTGYRLGPGEEPPAEPAVVDPAVAVADFTRFLGGLARGVRVRAADTVPYQADQRALVAAMDRGKRGEFPPFRPHAVPWGAYARELGLAFATAISYGLLEGRDGRWYSSERVGEWLELPPLAQWAAMIQAWLVAVVNHHGDPASRILPALLPQGEWCRPWHRWEFAFRHSVPDPLGDIRSSHNLVLALGIELGVLEHGDLGDEAWLVRLRPEAVAAVRWLEEAQASPPPFPAFDEVPRVQGTFEVLAGPRVPPPDIWTLELWADRVRLDRFATYRLTRASVTAAARRGADAEALLTLLGRSPGGIPQNVAFSLREWTGSIVRAKASVEIVLRAPDTAAAERLAPVLARQERLGPLAWLVPADALSQVWKAATAAGCELVGDPEQLRQQLRPVERGGVTVVGMGWPTPHRIPLPTPRPTPAYAAQETPPPSR